MTFWATLWVLTGMGQAAEGWAGLRRLIIENKAESTEMFKAQVQARWCARDAATQVWFGPVTRKA